MSIRRVRAIASGRVQGVSYRASTVDEARRLGLTGWVRNLCDGRVELEAQGDAARVTELLAWCAEGPPAAQVDAVDVQDLPSVAEESGFSVRR